MARKLKTPKQRAEEALAVAENRYERVELKLQEAQAVLVELEEEYELAGKRLRHASMNPDLENEDDDPLPFGAE